jgi:hypothetical protein
MGEGLTSDFPAALLLADCEYYKQQKTPRHLAVFEIFE